MAASLLLRGMKALHLRVARQNESEKYGTNSPWDQVLASNWPLYDVEHGRQAIGYDPQDRSEGPEEDWEK